MTLLYTDTKLVSKSKYLVVYTIAKSIWDFPDIPEKKKTSLIKLIFNTYKSTDVQASVIGSL